MKAWIRNKSNYDNPDDMKKIIDFLERNGRILVSHHEIEILWREFSETHCAGWLIVNDDLLERFADWLESDYEEDM